MIRRISKSTPAGCSGVRPAARRAALLWAMLATLLTLAAAHAQGPAPAPAEPPGVEIHSNGTGGGNWSEARAWHGGRVPGPRDTVVIAMRDTVTFDVPEAAGPLCAGLYLDPEAALVFKSGDAQYRLIVDGSVESYGLIRMDASRMGRGGHELRVLGTPAQGRTLRLMQYGGLVISGRQGLPEGQWNAVLAGGNSADPAARVPLTFSAGPDAVVDVQHARLTDVVLNLTSLDNTGANAAERLNIIGCRLEGLTRLVLYDCHTAAIRDNEFDALDAAVPAAAVHVGTCKLSQIQGNVFRGKYPFAVLASSDVDSSLSNNRIEGSDYGVQWNGSNAMMRGNRIRAIRRGLLITGSTGVMEDTAVAGAEVALEIAASPGFQLTNVQVSDIPEKGMGIRLSGGPLLLLNCNLTSSQIEVTAPPGGGVPAVETMQYLVLKVNGNRPPGLTALVRTAAASGGVPAGKADLNVRNAPARVDAQGLTPLPRTTRALVLRSWSLAGPQQRINAPFYDVILQVPDPEPGKPAKVLKQQLVEPQETWMRAEPDRPTATLEMSLP